MLQAVYYFYNISFKYYCQQSHQRKKNTSNNILKYITFATKKNIVVFNQKYCKNQYSSFVNTHVNSYINLSLFSRNFFIWICFDYSLKGNFD